jgi:hypothetical protein
MAIDFPNSPALDQEFTSAGVTWKYDGQKWVSQAAGGSPGTSYWDRTGTTLSPANAGDDVVVDGDIQTTSLNGGPLAGFRNLLVNGSFNNWQRGTSITSPATGNTIFVYGSDRWLFGAGTNKSITMQRNVGAPAGFATCGLTTIPADRSFTCRQRIEQLNSQGMESGDHTFSVYLRSSAAVSGVLRWSAATTADDFATLTDLGQTAISLPGDDTWHRYSTLVPADSAFANGAEVRFVIPAGNACTLRYTGAQLEPGPVATPFSQRPIGLEQQLCARYYQTVPGKQQLFAANSNTTVKTIAYARPVVMRIDPTETGDASIGTPAFAGTKNSIGITASSVNQTQASFISNYTADAEL